MSTVTVYYLDDQEFWNTPLDEKMPFQIRDMSVKEAVLFSRSEYGLSTPYLEIVCATKQIADEFAVAAYLEGGGVPKFTEVEGGKGEFSAILWDETGK